MAVNSSNSITAEVFNGLQSRISEVLGVGENTFGYGQTVSSSPVEQLTDVTLVDGDSVLAEQISNLRKDFNIVHRHQQGESNKINSFSSGDIVGADESGTDIEYALDGSITFLNSDATKGINNFFSLMSDFEINRFQIAANQQQVSIAASSLRTSSWNGSIDTVFLVEFASVDDRRYFFNAGGEIRFQGSVTNISTERGGFWQDLIENPSEIQFNYTATNNTGSTNGVSFPDGIIGNYDLTNFYQTVFRKDASFGLYSNSFWTIEAREENNLSISFKITLTNDGPESNLDAGQPGAIPGGIQESVGADIEFELSTLRAANAVTVSNPSTSVTNSL